MTTYYRVANWSENFETSETKKLKALKWVAVPNKQDGDGYTQLLDHERGPAHFGCWTAILQLASKCDLRGSLLRKFSGEWVPHDVESISRITRMPKSLVTVSIRRLLEIGWLEELPLSPGSSPGKTADAPVFPCLEGKEEKGIERKEDGDETIPPPPVNRNGKNGQRDAGRTLRVILTENDLSANNLDLTEWAIALTKRARIIKSEPETRAFFKWAVPFMRKREPDGPLHMRHSGTLPDEWPTVRLRHFQDGIATERITTGA